MYIIFIYKKTRLVQASFFKVTDILFSNQSFRVIPFFSSKFQVPTLLPEQATVSHHDHGLWFHQSACAAPHHTRPEAPRRHRTSACVLPSPPTLARRSPTKIRAAIQERAAGHRASPTGGWLRAAARSGWMEFEAMKRRELLELCRQHGLATRGSKADLAASLAGAISVRSPKRSLLPLCAVLPIADNFRPPVLFWGKTTLSERDFRGENPVKKEHF